MDASVSMVQAKKPGFIESMLALRSHRQLVRRLLRTISRSQFEKAKALQDQAVSMGLSVTGFEALQQVCGENRGLRDIQSELENCVSSQVRGVIGRRAQENEDYFHKKLIFPFVAYKMDTLEALSDRMQAAAIKACHVKQRMSLDPCWQIERVWKDGDKRIAPEEWLALQSDPRVAQALAAVVGGPLDYFKPPEGSLEWLRQARDWAFLPSTKQHPMSDEDRKFVVETIESTFARFVPGYAAALARRADQHEESAWKERHRKFYALGEPMRFYPRYTALAWRGDRDTDSLSVRQHIALIEEQAPGLARDFVVAKMLGTWGWIKAEVPPDKVGARFAKEMAPTRERFEDFVTAFDAVGGNAHDLSYMLEVFSAQGKRDHGSIEYRTDEVLDKELDSMVAQSNGVSLLSRLAYPS